MALALALFPAGCHIFSELFLLNNAAPSSGSFPSHRPGKILRWLRFASQGSIGPTPPGIRNHRSTREAQLKPCNKRARRSRAKASKGSGERASHRQAYSESDRQQPRDISSLNGLDFHQYYRSRLPREPESSSRERSRERAWDQKDRERHRPQSHSQGPSNRASSKDHLPASDWSQYMLVQEMKDSAEELTRKQKRDRLAEAAKRRCRERDDQDGEPKRPTKGHDPLRSHNMRATIISLKAGNLVPPGPITSYTRFVSPRSAARRPSAIRSLQPFLKDPDMISLGGS